MFKRDYPMKYFEMDNAAFEGDANNGDLPRRTGLGHGAATTTVELGELAPSRPPVIATAPLCKPALCRATMPAQATTTRPNPWHRHKTILLVGTVVGFVIWAVAYFLLAREGVL